MITLIIAWTLSLTLSIIVAAIFNAMTRDPLKYQRQAMAAYLARLDEAKTIEDRILALNIYEATIDAYRKAGLIRD